MSSSSQGMYMRCLILYYNSHLQFTQFMKVRNRYLGFSKICERWQLVTPLGPTAMQARLANNKCFNKANLELFQSNNGLPQCLEAFTKKLLNIAFNRLKSVGILPKDRNSEGFIPGQLTRSKAQLQPEFQRKYKRQRAESYIRMKWKCNKSSCRVADRLTNALEELLIKKKVLAFKKIKEPQLAIESRGTLEQTSDGLKTLKKVFGEPFSTLFRTPSKNSRTLNLTYIKLNTTPEKAKVNYACSHSLAHQAELISVQQLLTSQTSNQYRYSSEDHKWRRIQVNFKDNHYR